MRRLEGKVAVVTGGASGIGRAVAITFAREGARVVVADVRREPKESGEPTDLVIEQQGGVAVFVPVDVSVVGQIQELIDSVVGRFGRVDIMANVAGINIFQKATDFREDEFDKIIAVNLKGVFFCSVLAIKRMLGQRSGSIINVSSNLGLVGTPEMVPYCASKAGVIGLTKALAVEYGPYNIRVNALCPGATKTEINREFRQRADVIEAWKRQTPLVRPDGEFLGEPQDIANAALFLASDESRYMTGACLLVDGGWNAM